MKLRALIVVPIVAAVVSGCGGGGGSGSGGSSSAPDVTGAPTTDQATLFKAANLKRVLTEVNTHLKAGANLTTIKIEPRDVKVVADGQVVTVDNKGRSLTVITPSIPSTGTPATLSVIDPAVVEQLATKAAATAHKTLKDVAYVAFIPGLNGEKPSLGVYMTDLSYYTAEINGAHFKAHSAGGTAGASSAAAAAATPAGTPAAAAGTASQSSGGGGTVIDPQKIATCVQNAGGDPSKIQACTGH